MKDLEEERAATAIQRVAGPVVEASGLKGVRLGEVVHVGPTGLLGEVIRLAGELAVIQVYEDTSGLVVGDSVVPTGSALEVELGPGLLGTIFDGIQRPLSAWAAGEGGPHANPFLSRSVQLPALDRERAWEFEPAVSEGEQVNAGALLGSVNESAAVVHRILVPAGRQGKVTRVRRGAARVDEPVVWIDEEPVCMLTRWPVRRPRPISERLDLERPLVTGQRVIDLLCPIAMGGVATIPGGFGTGKTVQEQTLAKWAEADVVVYVGCGERGNELAEILDEFGQLTDPRSGSPLMARTICVANTSNMPIAAREASIYTGITLAEYFRDQGYDVALMADSISRWGEALREVSGRLEELPGEEGYPTYLSARIAEFFERAGAVVGLGGHRRGSVTIVAAVSPPGGDFSEPITQQCLRLAGTFWALDTELARRRHYPAINWNESYTLYELDDWFSREVDPGWTGLRRWALALLQEEQKLLESVQLLGLDALGPSQRVVLQTGRRLREDLLWQSAFDPLDAYCPLPKQYWMLEVIRCAHGVLADTVGQGISLEGAAAMPALAEVAGMRSWPPDEAVERGRGLCARLLEQARLLTTEPAR